ncbi:hypothetical protein BLJAPNOD_02784 [Ensifer sp. M14]|nr:hypothetical protein BLJAPNOD_02784 [Ensifer sp. M14]
MKNCQLTHSYVRCDGDFADKMPSVSIRFRVSEMLYLSVFADFLTESRFARSLEMLYWRFPPHP